MLLRFSGEFDNEKVSQKRTDRDFTKKRRERARLPASSPRLLSQILVVLLFLSLYSLLRVFNKSFIITTKIIFSVKKSYNLFIRNRKFGSTF